MFCGLNIPLIMLIFYMDMNIRRNVGVLFCILASEHPVNPIVLAAVMISAFIIQIYTPVFLPFAHIEVVRTGRTYGSDWHHHCAFYLCWENMDEVCSAVKEFRSRWERFRFIYKFLSSHVSERVCRPASSGSWQHIVR